MNSYSKILSVIQSKNKIHLYFLRNFLFFLLGLVLSFNLQAQSDSLPIELINCKDPICKIQTYQRIARESAFTNPKQAIALAEKSVELALSQKDNDLITESYETLAYIHRHAANYKASIDNYFLSLKYAEKNKNYRMIAYANAQLGIIYILQKDYATALEKLLLAEKLVKGAPDNWARGKLYDAIANCYTELNDRANAERNFDTSEVYFLKSGNAAGIAEMFCNRAEIYFRYREISKALEKLEQARPYVEKANSNNSSAAYSLGMGRYFLHTNNTAKAKSEFEKALRFAEGFGSAEARYNAYSGLYDVSNKAEDYKSALNFFRLKVAYADSMKNDALLKNIAKADATHEYSKKHLLDSLKHEKENAIKRIKMKEKDEKLKNEQKIKYGLFGIIALVLIFAAYILKSYLDKSRSNKIILAQKIQVEQQKYIIEEHQKEITDSINYARRIQNALLAQESLIQNYVEHFVFFQPKDIVSGDFYWAAEFSSESIVSCDNGENSTQKNIVHDKTTHNNQLTAKNPLYLAVCDSTGHGIPGAFMSLLNMGFLTEGLLTRGIKDPGNLFDFVRNMLISSISKEGQRDGFDGILLKMEKNNDKLKIFYSAANNAPVLCAGGKLTELDKDKMPVGSGERKDSFNTFETELSKGDILYLYTDGYADQFGGPKGKKFKYKQLNDLLMEIHQLPLSTQKEKLKRKFEEWKGDLEQVDDVTVIAIKI